MPITPVLASGGAKFSPTSLKIIRFIRKGCVNRPFYHLVVMEQQKEPTEQCIEQLGSFDPIPNANNEKLVSLNLERIRYWIGEGAIVASRPKQILGMYFKEKTGLSGFLPLHPVTYTRAWRAREPSLQPVPNPPNKVTWRDRKKRFIQEAEEAQEAPEAQGVNVDTAPEQSLP